MADKSSEVDPGFEIKHRIVGALVLISAAIIILPEILREPGSNEPSVKSRFVKPLVQNQESEGFVSKITPIAKVANPLPTAPSSKPKSKSKSKKSTNNRKQIVQPKPMAEAVPLKTAKLEQPKPLDFEEPKTQKKKNTAFERTPPSKANPPKKVAKPKAKKTPQTTPSPKVVAVTKAAMIERGWEIRIGTFAQPDNAKRIMAVLRKQGFDPHKKTIKTDKGTVTRVWVGPFATRVTAGRTRAAIEAKTKHKGWIAPYPE